MEPAEAVKYHIGYYLWVPVMLLVQSVLFYVPCLLLRVSGININNLVEAADTIQNALYPERRDKTIKSVCQHFTLKPRSHSLHDPTQQECFVESDREV